MSNFYKHKTIKKLDIFMNTISLLNDVAIRLATYREKDDRDVNIKDVTRAIGKNYDISCDMWDLISKIENIK